MSIYLILTTNKTQQDIILKANSEVGKLNKLNYNNYR